MGTRTGVLLLLLHLCVLSLFSTGNSNDANSEELCKDSLRIAKDEKPLKKSSNVDSYTIHGKAVRFDLKKSVKINGFSTVCGLSDHDWVKDLRKEIDAKGTTTKLHLPTTTNPIIPTPGRQAGDKVEKKLSTSSPGPTDDVKHTAASTPKTHEPTTETVTLKAPENTKTPTITYVKVTKTLPPTSKESIIPTPGKLAGNEEEKKPDTSSSGLTDDVKHTAASTPKTHEPTTEIVTPKAPEDPKTPTMVYASLGSMDGAKNIETQNPKTNEPSTETVTPKAPEETRTWTMVYGKTTKPFPPTTNKPVISTQGMLHGDMVEEKSYTSPSGRVEDVKNIAASTPKTHEPTTEIVTSKSLEDTRAPTMVYVLGNSDDAYIEELCNYSLRITKDERPVKKSCNVDSYVILGKYVRFNLKNGEKINGFSSICGLLDHNWVREMKGEIDARASTSPNDDGSSDMCMESDSSGEKQMIMITTLSLTGIMLFLVSIVTYLLLKRKKERESNTT